MPIRNLFKNCSYYYGFAAYVAYFVNHPAYTPPGQTLSLVCFGLAVLAQLSNLRCVRAGVRMRCGHRGCG
jgi:very-long-chain enoyl-CoA reductase